MPFAARRPCSHQGCRELVAARFCTEHAGAAKVGKYADASRGTRQQRGYDATWTKTRERILRRDQGLCQPCCKADPPRITMATQVDHVIPKHDPFSTEDDGNLQSICTPCHRAKSAAEGHVARWMGGRTKSLESGAGDRLNNQISSRGSFDGGGID